MREIDKISILINTKLKKKIKKKAVDEDKTMSQLIGEVIEKEFGGDDDE